MPPSIRAQSAACKRRKTRELKRAEDRSTAVGLLESGMTVAEVVRTTPINRTTADRLKHCTDSADRGRLGKLLNPRDNRDGHRPVLSHAEDEMIKAFMKKSAELGCAFSATVTQQAMAGIANDGRPDYDNDIPSAAALRSWRERNRNVSFRKAEAKEAAKLAAENPYHLKSFASALSSVQRKKPGLFLDPDRIWNRDETEITIDATKNGKVFVSALMNSGVLKWFIIKGQEDVI